ncbi:hypothetical protein [Saccharibacillus brassicae]|uniref:Uncharacterized protein n=1 Tax=Saccharibacillus brassicae TaxID=2583377 RepID=A0A4Y6V3X8_SACBS|nr:hypothetical protein [Saccharibacillus brassicae]QDH23217.1 hypothetical protein FFV09_21550 [Saccharibacillus brassicae]
MGSRYEAVRELEPIIRQVIEKLEPDKGPDEQERRDAAANTLASLDRRELWVIETVREIGFSGRGCRTVHTGEPGGFTLEFFAVPIEESVDELLKRYAELLEYQTEKQFITRLTRYRGVSAELEEGLRLLTELHHDKDDKASGPWPEPASLEPDPTMPTEIVLLGIFDDFPSAYALREDLVRQLPELQLKFDRWLGGLNYVSPLHQLYEEYSEEGELMDRAYRAQYGASHFVDWLNARYGQYVGREVPVPANKAGLTVLNF